MLEGGGRSLTVVGCVERWCEMLEDGERCWKVVVGVGTVVGCVERWCEMLEGDGRC